jgi:hypothetical protein
VLTPNVGCPPESGARMATLSWPPAAAVPGPPAAVVAPAVPAGLVTAPVAALVVVAAPVTAGLVAVTAEVGAAGTAVPAQATSSALTTTRIIRNNIVVRFIVFILLSGQSKCFSNL